MEEILKRDANSILEKFNKERDESKKRQYAYDYMGINDMLSRFFFDNNLNISNDIYSSFIYKQVKDDEEKEYITKQIYSNLSKLETIYSNFLEVFKHIDYSKIITKEEKLEFDLNILKDFFKSINLDNELSNILKNNRLFFFDRNNVASSVTLKSIDKQYVFLTKDNNFSGMKMFSHEMGHIHASNITKDIEVKDNNFLNEFMSIMFENLFLNYIKDINSQIGFEENLQNLMGIYMIVSQAHNQIILMQSINDIFIKMELNPIYQELYNNINRRKIDNKSNSLKLQYYALGSLLSLTFIKNNINLKQINNFYKDNINNNLNYIINYISISDLNEYVLDSFNRDKVKMG